jgi:hypothetical protein
MEIGRDIYGHHSEFVSEIPAEQVNTVEYPQLNTVGDASSGVRDTDLHVASALGQSGPDPVSAFFCSSVTRRFSLMVRIPRFEFP